MAEDNTCVMSDVSDDSANTLTCEVCNEDFEIYDDLGDDMYVTIKEWKYVTPECTICNKLICPDCINVCYDCIYYGCSRGRLAYPKGSTVLCNGCNNDNDNIQFNDRDHNDWYSCEKCLDKSIESEYKQRRQLRREDMLSPL